MSAEMSVVMGDSLITSLLSYAFFINVRLLLKFLFCLFPVFTTS